MKKYILILHVVLTQCLLSCSNSDGDINVSPDIMLGNNTLNVNYGESGSVSILSDNSKNYQIKTDNDFIATCSISDKTIIVSPKHVGRTFVTITNGDKNTILYIFVKPTIQSVCGSPIMMFGKPYSEVKDSLEKISKQSNIKDYYASTKIQYQESNTDGYIFTYTYYFNHDYKGYATNLKAININFGSTYGSIDMSKFQILMAEKYDFISLTQIKYGLTSNLYKYSSNTWVKSFEQRNNGNYDIIINISDNIDTLSSSFDEIGNPLLN